MNIGTFSIILVALPKSCEKLTVFPFFGQPLSGSVQTPSNSFTCQYASSFLWISYQLITISNPHISANMGMYLYPTT